MIQNLSLLACRFWPRKKRFEMMKNALQIMATMTMAMDDEPILYLKTRLT